MSPSTRSKPDFLADPVLFVELAHAWAAGGKAPRPDHEAWLAELARPCLSPSPSARKALWGVLGYPERGRALTWLDRNGLLAELLPCWNAPAEHRDLRLRAVEEIHLERWAAGLSKTVFDWLCVYNDGRFGQLGGWALCALAVLLLEGRDNATAYAVRVETDLHTLGVDAAVIGRVKGAILEYEELLPALRSGILPVRNVNPASIVATLADIMARPDFSAESQAQAIFCADRLLARWAAPERPAPRPRKS